VGWVPVWFRKEGVWKDYEFVQVLHIVEFAWQEAELVEGDIEVDKVLQITHLWRKVCDPIVSYLVNELVDFIEVRQL